MNPLLAEIEAAAWPQRTVIASSSRAMFDPGRSARALSDLKVDLADQDCVDALFARAQPLMLRLALHPDAVEGPALLVWLVDTLLDGHGQWLLTGFHPGKEGRGLLKGQVQRHFRLAYRHLEAARPALLSALSDERPPMRAAAAFALSWLGAHAAELLGPLGEALDREADPRAEATMVVAFALLARAAPVDLAPLRHRLEQPQLARAAAWGLAIADPAPMSDEVFELLLAGWSGPPDLGLAYHLDGPALYLERLAREVDRAEAVDAAARARLQSPEVGQVAARHLLARAGEPAPEALLRAIAECPWATRPGGLTPLGLPGLHRLRADLGLPARYLDPLAAWLDDSEGARMPLVERVGSDVHGAWAAVEAAIDCLPPEGPDRSRRLGEILALAIVLAPTTAEDQAARIDGIAEEVRGHSLESRAVSEWLGALPTSVAEPRVLAAMRDTPLRYCRAHPTSATAALAVEQMAEALQADRFGRRGRKRADRARMTQRSAEAWFQALDGHSLARVAELAALPIKHGAHDDRVVFLRMLILGLPGTRALLEPFLTDKSAPIRRLVEEALG